MTRFIALGTLSLVVALSLVVVPLVNAQTFDNYTSASPTVSASPSVSASPTMSASPSVSSSPSTRGATSNSTTSPGLPNTGVGGEAAKNLSILLASGLVVVGGIILLSRRMA
ncbi:hypothetical protein KW782_00890 [Candidatus Parcubacteria bacterium]|nr:hypothetical protein [Candidatus Parcubacteria bacterium]